MKDWLVFEHDSGEVIFVKRDAITSFHPKYVHTIGYVVYATVGGESKPIYRCVTKEEARSWCDEQIGLISGKEKKRE